MEKLYLSTFYAEMTPNPAVMKFVCNTALLDPGVSAEYSDPGETKGSELAKELFQLPFVRNVFISGNFISITKNNSVSWEEINPQLREFLRVFMLKGIPAVSVIPTKEVFVDSAFLEKREVHTQHVVPQNETEQKIVEVLDQYIRPAVESDGGLITFKSLDAGKVTVQLRGACSGCPSSTLTLKAGIETLLKRMIPEVQEVVAESL